MRNFKGKKKKRKKKRNLKSHVVKSRLLLALFDHIQLFDSQRQDTSEFYTNHDKTFQTHISK